MKSAYLSILWQTPHGCTWEQWLNPQDMQAFMIRHMQLCRAAVPYLLWLMAHHKPSISKGSIQCPLRRDLPMSPWPTPSVNPQGGRRSSDSSWGTTCNPIDQIFKAWGSRGICTCWSISRLKIQGWRFKVSTFHTKKAWVSTFISTCSRCKARNFKM